MLLSVFLVEYFANTRNCQTQITTASIQVLIIILLERAINVAHCKILYYYSPSYPLALLVQLEWGLVLTCCFSSCIWTEGWQRVPVGFYFALWEGSVYLLVFILHLGGHRLQWGTKAALRTHDLPSLHLTPAHAEANLEGGL